MTLQPRILLLENIVAPPVTIVGMVVELRAKFKGRKLTMDF